MPEKPTTKGSQRPPALPAYYSSLGAFHDYFRSGRPVLTYHHVGPRKRGARLRGLYVRPKLFLRQLTELKAAGFSTPEYSSLLQSVPEGRKVVFLTFDDGFRDVFDNAMEPMRLCAFRGIQFLVADLLGKTNEWQQRAGDVVEPLMDTMQIREWLAAGHEIGSHTLTHPRLSQLPPAQAREEVSASRKKLEDLFGRPIRHFCYPYGDWNEPVRALVQEAGYETACTTGIGINQTDTPPFLLKRVTARYASRNWRTARDWFRRRVG